MNIKEEFQKEKDSLLNVKKPYETAAFILFGVFFIQQVFYIFLQFLNYLDRVGIRNDFVDNGGATYKVNWTFGSTPNMPAFVTRILNMGSDKFLYIMLSFLFLALWYFLVWLLIWNYCRKRGLAKWTWTTLFLFGPTNILLVPTYLIYAVYVFRPYVFRFIRKGVMEYKKYGSDHVFQEELEEDHEEFKV